MFTGLVIATERARKNTPKELTSGEIMTEKPVEMIAEETNKELIKLTIIGPEGEDFSSSQARMYKAKLENNYDYTGKFANCNWKYYLNEYSDEVFYKEQENRSVLREESQEICGFTSTFIDKRGKLRVVLTVDIVDNNQEALETLTAEREYTVK